MRFALLAPAAAIALSGCINWQGSYDYAARTECGKIIESGDRQACYDSVEKNSRERRAEERKRREPIVPITDEPDRKKE